MLLSLGVASAISGQRAAWFGLGLVLAIVVYFVGRWLRLPIPRWLGGLILGGIVGAGIALATM